MCDPVCIVVCARVYTSRSESERDGTGAGKAHKKGASDTAKQHRVPTARTGLRYWPLFHARKEPFVRSLFVINSPSPPPKKKTLSTVPPNPHSLTTHHCGARRALVAPSMMMPMYAPLGGTSLCAEVRGSE